MATQSHACCTVPPVQVDYKAKGQYIDVDGIKTYATGPADAKRAILIVYDIFGYYAQTLQGADILATGDRETPCQVFMPDFFGEHACPIEWYPPDTPEKEKKIGEWFGAHAGPPQQMPKVGKVVNALKQQRGIEAWGIVGFCWGGKIATLLSQGESLFKAAASCHPAMVDPSDAEKLSIPFMMLPSKDEDKETCEKHKAAQKTPGFTEFFPTQVHGFMAARSNLSDPEVKKEYERAYKLVLDFFHDHV